MATYFQQLRGDSSVAVLSGQLDNRFGERLFVWAKYTEFLRHYRRYRVLEENTR
jgi:hypothetical protein